MIVYWAGDEDVDFPYMGGDSANGTAATFRTGWSRGSILYSQNNPAFARSDPFAAGPLTSAWMTFIWTCGGQGQPVNGNMVGFGQSTSGRVVGIGTDASSFKIVLFKFDGTTRTVLGTENASSVPVANNRFRYDLQITNFGVTATVNVYCNFALILSGTFDTTLSGMSNFDCVQVCGYAINNQAPSVTEIVVADSDTRQIQGLQTLVLTGSGTTNNWNNNSFSNINQFVMSDATPTSVNTTGQNQQYNITDGVLAAYSVIAVVISARIAKTSASVPTQIKLGYNSGGTVAFGAGATKTPGLGFAVAHQIDMINPVTGLAFQQSEINALQLNLQSA